MPTPSGDAPVRLSPPIELENTIPSRSTCPPEDLRLHSHINAAPESHIPAQELSQQPTPPADAGSPRILSSHGKELCAEDYGHFRDTATPVSAEDDHSEGDPRRAQPLQGSTTPPPPVSHCPTILTNPFPTHRFLPNSTSSFLRPGSKFRGTQQSDRQIYDVQVEIQHVDMSESFLCGYLRIQGLTDDHPTLTTYFEGEIIGTRYSFVTKHPEWGSSEKVDMQHWGRFPAWRQLGKQAKRSDFSYRNYAQRENIFMRWKEHFLVPDHRVRTISGASFEGFYYICFNQITGTVSGIYFHARSEKFQQLELKHVNDFGCQGAIEFR